MSPFLAIELSHSRRGIAVARCRAFGDRPFNRRKPIGVQGQGRGGKRFGELIAPARAKHGDDIVSLPGDPGYCRLGDGYPDPAGGLPKRFGQSKVCIGVAPLEAGTVRLKSLGAICCCRQWPLRSPRDRTP